MTTATCTTTLDLVDRAVRGTLDPESRARLEGHVVVCQRCAEALEDARVSVEFLTAEGRPLCPAPLVDRILAKALETSQATTVHAVPIERRRRGFDLPPWSRARRLAPAFALAAALVLALWVPRVSRGPNERAALGTNPTLTMEANQAANETREALRILANAVQHASRAANEQVGAGLSRPVLRGLEESMDRLPPPFGGLVSRTGESGRT